MYFRSDQKKCTAYSPIKLNSETLNITDTYKYLGITLDINLNYKIHVENLTKQLKQKMFVYSKIRSHITKSTSATYLNAVILSTLSYCLPLWSLTSQTTLNPVIQLYNRAYTIHANRHLRSHHCNALQESNALHFENYCKLLAMKTYFQIQHNDTAVIIFELLPKHSALRQNRKTCSVTNKENLLQRYRNNYGRL